MASPPPLSTSAAERKPATRRMMAANATSRGVSGTADGRTQTWSGPHDPGVHVRLVDTDQQLQAFEINDLGLTPLEFHVAAPEINTD